jgi:hypothetical protein
MTAFPLGWPAPCAGFLTKWHSLPKCPATSQVLCAHCKVCGQLSHLEEAPCSSLGFLVCSRILHKPIEQKYDSQLEPVSYLAG